MRKRRVNDLEGQIMEGRMLRKQKARGVVSLTKREQQVLMHIWEGFRNRDIGTQLKISPKTVEAHRANMMKKLRVTNAAQLLKQCLEQGFIPQPRISG